MVRNVGSSRNSSTIREGNSVKLELKKKKLAEMDKSIDDMLAEDLKKAKANRKKK